MTTVNERQEWRYHTVCFLLGAIYLKLCSRTFKITYISRRDLGQDRIKYRTLSFASLLPCPFCPSPKKESHPNGQ